MEQNAGYYFGQMGFANATMQRRGVYEVDAPEERIGEKRNLKKTRMNLALFCSKVLQSGFGIFDACGRLYSLCGYRSQVSIFFENWKSKFLNR